MYFLAVSCTKTVNDRTNMISKEIVTTINVPVNYEKKQEPDSIFSDYQFIVLETNENCLISDPQKVVIKNQNIFIQDFNKSLFMFGLDGKFKKKIGEQGRGPGEYLQLAAFEIDDNNNIYILDYHKIIQFSPEGTFINSQNLNLSSKSFQCWPEQFKKIDSGYYLWSGSLAIKDNDKMQNFAMYRVSEDFIIEDGYFPLTHKIMNSFSRFRPFDEIYNIDPIFGNDTIYAITKDGIKARYYIDFGKRALSEKIPNEFKSLSSFKSKIAPYTSFSPRRFTETQEWIYFIFSHNFKNYNVFYSKENDKCFVSPLITETKRNSSIVKWIDSSWGDSLVVFLEPNEILSNINNNTIDGFKIKEDVLYNLTQMKVTDNPVLLICSMKK